jgi:hypothetical protein
MVQIKAATAEEYLERIPADARDTIATLRKLILKHLPKGYIESINYGMIAYEIPLKTFPDTYNKQPLIYIGLAAQKNHFALYLTCAYGAPERIEWLKDAFEKAGKKLDMGKSCMRFKKLDDLPLDVIAEVVGSVTPAQYIARYTKIKSEYQESKKKPARQRRVSKASKS